MNEREAEKAWKLLKRELVHVNRLTTKLCHNVFIVAYRRGYAAAMIENMIPAEAPTPVRTLPRRILAGSEVVVRSDPYGTMLAGHLISPEAREGEHGVYTVLGGDGSRYRLEGRIYFTVNE